MSNNWKMNRIYSTPSSFICLFFVGTVNRPKNQHNMDFLEKKRKKNNNKSRILSRHTANHKSSHINILFFFSTFKSLISAHRTLVHSYSILYASQRSMLCWLPCIIEIRKSDCTLYAIRYTETETESEYCEIIIKIKEPYDRWWSFTW